MFFAIIKKILSAIPLFFIISIILFVMINALPGNAAYAILGEGSSEAIERLSEQLGLNDPVMVRYFRWLGNALKGDWGVSLYSNEPVFIKIMHRLPVSAEVVLLSMGVSILVSLPVSIACAVKRNSKFDYIASFFSALGVAMPAFWLGIMLVSLFAIHLKVLPASGFVKFSDNILLNLRSMILPVTAVSFSFAATLIRQSRSAMLEVLGQDYMLTAKAKGLPNRTVLVKHGLRNAASPIVTVISGQVGGIICGMVVTEQVYLVPGMGQLLYNSILTRDYPVIMAQIMLMVALVVFVNILVDIIYIILDPRISHRLQSK